MTPQERAEIYLQGYCHAIDVAEQACKQNAMRSPAVAAQRREGAKLALQMGLKGN